MIDKSIFSTKLKGVIKDPTKNLDIFCEGEKKLHPSLILDINKIQIDCVGNMFLCTFLDDKNISLS